MNFLSLWLRPCVAAAQAHKLSSNLGEMSWFGMLLIVTFQCLLRLLCLLSCTKRTEITCSGFRPPFTDICIFYILIASFSSFHGGYRKFRLNNWSRIKHPMYSSTSKRKMHGRFERRLYFFYLKSRKIWQHYFRRASLFPKDVLGRGKDLHGSTDKYVHLNIQASANMKFQLI